MTENRLESTSLGYPHYEQRSSESPTASAFASPDTASVNESVEITGLCRRQENQQTNKYLCPHTNTRIQTIADERIIQPQERRS